MAAPVITMQSVDHYKISRVTGLSRTTVTFVVDQPVDSWEVRVGGAGVGQGALAEADPGAIADSAVADTDPLAGITGNGVSLGAVCDTADADTAVCQYEETATQTALIDWNEGLAEGGNQVNIYAINSKGEATPYDQT